MRPYVRALCSMASLVRAASAPAKNDGGDKKQPEGSKNQIRHMDAVWFPNAVDLVTEHDGKIDSWVEQIKKQLDLNLIAPYATDYVWQLESCPKTGRYHCQMYVYLTTKQYTNKMGKECGTEGKLNGITFRPASNNGISGAIKYYCAKSDSRVAGPFSNKPISMVEKPTGWDVEAVKTKPFPWQKKVWEEVKKKCKDDRKIDWVYDPAGNSGKTKLIKMLTAEKLVIPVQYGPARDLMNLLSKNAGAGAYIFDLTRAKPETMPGDDIYSVMEGAKNGMIQNTKYETNFATFDPPHMWVMANVLPEFAKLTRDRWRVWVINDRAELEQWVEGWTGNVIPRAAGGSEVQDDDTLGEQLVKAAEAIEAVRYNRCPSEAEKKMHRAQTERRLVGTDESGGLTARAREWQRWDAIVTGHWQRCYDDPKLDVAGVACLHNVWGCDKCDMLSEQRDKYDPPIDDSPEY